MNGIKIILIIFNILLILSTVFAHGFAFTASQTSSPLCPRESGLFKDIIKNTDTTSKQFSVSLSGGAAQFSTVFPNSFILAAGEEKEIYSYVTPRTETQPGTYELSINFASGSDTHSINHPVIVKDCYGVGLTTDQTTATVCPSEISRFELTVRNNGEYSETYSLSAEGQIMDRISLSDNQVILNINDSSLSIFEETSSMLPVINHHSKAIEIKPDKLSIGDIISYKDNEVIVVHRIVDIGADSEGTYYITKGDNNNAVDQKKVRFNDVQGKIVVIIY